MQAYYARAGTKDKLSDLTVTTIKAKKGSIELTASGAQIRALVPFGKELVDSWNELNVENTAAKICMHHLYKCYSFLAADGVGEEDGDLLTHVLAFQRNHRVFFLFLNLVSRPRTHLLHEFSLDAAGKTWACAQGLRGPEKMRETSSHIPGL